jgi:Helix-turn-helix domain
MEPLINTAKAAALLGVSPRTLEGWRCEEIGPDYIEISPRRIRYAMEDLIKWRDERRRIPSVQGAVEQQMSRILKRR